MHHNTTDWARAVRRFVLVYLVAGLLVFIALVLLYVDFGMDQRGLKQAELFHALSDNLRTLEQISARGQPGDDSARLSNAIGQRDRLLERLAGEDRHRTVPPEEFDTALRELRDHWSMLRTQLRTPADRQSDGALMPLLLRQDQLQESLRERFFTFYQQQHHRRTRLLIILALVLLVGLAVGGAFSWRLLAREHGTKYELHRERERLRDFVDLVDMIFVLLDVRGTVLSINRAGAQLLGLPAEQIVGRNWFDAFIPPRDRDTIRNIFGHIRRGELEPLEYFENPVVDAEGQEHLILWHNTVSVDESGAPAHIISAGLDVSQLKQTQLELARSEHKYATLLNTLPYGVQEIDTDGTIVYSNPRHDRIYGYAPGQMRGMNVCELPAEAQQRQALCEHLNTLVRERPAPQRFVSVDKTADGRLIDVEVEWDYLYDTAGKLNGFISVITDVTRQKAMQQALAESEARFREIMEHSNQIYWLGSRSPFRLVYISPQIRSICDLDVAEVYQDPERFLERVHPGDHPRVEENHRRWLAGDIDEYAIEYRIRRGDGTVKWLHSRCYPIYENGAITRFCGVIRDVTQRKRAEQALRDSEAVLRQVTENINSVFYLHDIAAEQMIYVSPAFERLWGISTETLYRNPRAFTKRIHPDDKPRVLRRLQQQIDDGPMFNDEYRITAADGEVRWIHARSFPIKNAMGQTYRIAGLAEDISERKHMELALKESEEKYRAFIEQASDPVFIADMQGRLLEGNSRGLELLGYSRNELARLEVWDIHPDSELPRIERAFRELNEHGHSLYNDGFVVSKAGETIPIEIAASSIEFQGRRVAIGIFRDISERKRLEAQRLERERRQRESLVREVHHRIKNNLQGVIGLLRESMDVDSPRPQLMAQAIEQIRTIAVVYGLQARVSTDELRLCDLTEAIVRQTRQLLPAGFALDFDQAVAAPVSVAEEDAVPLALVINELMTNAVKHTPAGVDAGCIEVRLSIDGGTACLLIHNHGARLPAEVSLSERRGLGTGLQLVLALLPHRGASLEIRQTERGVEARLELADTVLNPGAAGG